jgi:hypothetical protein
LLTQFSPREPSRRFPLPLIGKRWFYRVAQYPVPPELTYEIQPDTQLLKALTDKGADLFTFIERTFLHPAADRSQSWGSSMETVGLLRITAYEDWLKTLSHKERNLVKKAQRVGLDVHRVDVDETFVRGAFELYNETPIRQGRKYSGYGLTLEDVRKKYANLSDSEVLGAYHGGKLIGLMWLGFGDQVATVISFISLISQRDKSPNNALMANAVKRCSEKGYRFLTYGNMGYNPGLDSFKKNNGFRMFPAPRHFVPLTSRGQLAVKLNLCQSIEHSFSPTLTKALVPFYNVVTKALPEKSTKPNSATDT